MKLKKLISALLCLAVMLSLTLPAAAASSFDDMEDSPAAVQADMLRLLGIIGGVGDNRFEPQANLTRAQFCTMAVRLLGREDEAVNYSARTIFRDVTAAHWGRSYINLAASILIGDGSTRLIAGVGDGRFLPDQPITCAQAVTILMRVLGYTDSDAGAIWPDGYLALAASVGLTEGLELSANSSLTREQAVELFANLLCTAVPGGGLYYTTLGSCVENVLILDADGGDGAVRTSLGTYPIAADVPAPTALEGLRGTLVLNEKRELLTFIPTGGESRTVVLAQDAQASALRGKDGTRYSVSAETPVYTGEGETVYSKAWLELRAGTAVTLYLEQGRVTGIYCPGTASDAAQSAVVVTGTVSEALFHDLTGGAGGFTVLKDGEPISLSDIRPYDVVTYQQWSNTLVVSDLSLPVLYQNAFPSPQNPETITVLGHEFPVLESAWESIGQFGIGDSVTLLLTADGSVAGMTATAQSERTMVGIADASGVTVRLPSGGSIRLSGEVEQSLQGKLVTVSAQSGRLGLTRLPVLTADGPLDVKSMTLGTHRLAAGAEIYEQVSGGVPALITLSEVQTDTIPAGGIVTYHLNTSGMVDLLVLNDLTGDLYSYGLLAEGEQEHGGMISTSNRTVSVTNGSGVTGPFVCAADFRQGAFGGIAASGRTVGGLSAAAGVLELKEIKNVRRSDFFQHDGQWYVRAEGAVYPVAERVEGYLSATGVWLEQNGEVLSAMRVYSDDLTVYVDPIGGKVRIITAD